MKRRYAIAIVVPLLVSLAGCEPEAPPAVPPSPPPPASAVAASPADIAAVTDGAVTQETVAGLMILTKRVAGAELAAIQLYARGGARNWGAADAGVEGLAVSTAAAGGAGKLDKDAFARKLAALGSEIGAASGNDYAVFSAKALTSTFDETFGLLADTFLTPAMPADEVEIHRQEMLSRLRHEQEAPDARLELMTHKAIFKGHPYEHRAAGTLESVAGLSPATIASHLTKLRETSRLLLVVVGDVDPARVAALARAKFGGVPRGAYRDTPMPALAFDKPKLEVESATIPTNYVQGTFLSPGFHDADFYAAMVASEYLDFRIFEEVRTKRNLSYAPHAHVHWATGVPIGDLYVTAVDPDAAIRVMFDEVKKLKAQPMAAKDLAASKASLLTSHLVSGESTDGQASWLARAQIYGGDFRFEAALLPKVKAVTASEVQAYANKWIKNLQFEVIGGKKLDAQLFGSM